MKSKTEADDIAQVDNHGRIVLPQKMQESVGINPHDSLIIRIKDDSIVLKKQKVSVFDLQLQPKEVAKGTLKRALIFERNIDKAGKKDMPL